MTRLFALWLCLILLAPLARADVIADWIAVANIGDDGKPLPPPPLQDRAGRSAPALVALAMFEAANALDPRFKSFLRVAPAPQRGAGAAEAAVATAAHGVLVVLYPNRRAELDAAIAISLTGRVPADVLLGARAVGTEAAAAALAHPLFDGPAAEPTRPAAPPGVFVNPEPSLIAPWTLAARPFFLADLAEDMPPPPPPLTSAIYARDLAEVQRIGGIGQPGATDETLARARFLAGFDLDPIIVRLAAARPRVVDRARLWALVRMAQFDANAVAGHAKARYSTWRPHTAIRNADRDGNPATDRDAGWTPVMRTPNHPEYPCGHCTMSGLLAGLLAPEVSGPIEVASIGAPLPVTMRFADWTAFEEAASLARIQGGMHFRFSNEAGRALGHRIATLARSRFAPPVGR